MPGGYYDGMLVTENGCIKGLVKIWYKKSDAAFVIRHFWLIMRPCSALGLVQWSLALAHSYR